MVSKSHCNMVSKSHAGNKNKNRQSIWKDTEGSAWAWLVVLVSLFVLILVWGSVGPAVDKLWTTVNNTTDMRAEMTQPMDFLLLVWKWWPVMMVGGLILWAIAYSVYREAFRGLE